MKTKKEIEDKLKYFEDRLKKEYVDMSEYNRDLMNCKIISLQWVLGKIG